MNDQQRGNHQADEHRTVHHELYHSRTVGEQRGFETFVQIYELINKDEVAARP